jgi:hypothetical protein
MTDIEVFEDLIRRSSLCNSASIRKQEDNWVITLYQDSNRVDIVFDEKGEIK